jgi:S-disulfanyl-L-cysteine oxidoreductase SoxD
MRFRIAVLALVGAWAATAWHAALRAQEPPAPLPRSVLDGAYTEDQAKRGEALFGQECSQCHGANMEGMDMAPPLAGGAFIANWNGLSVGELFDRIRLSMPDGNPGKLSRQQNADVVAYILKFSKYPAGKTELARDTETLKQIKIEPPKP